MSQENVEKLREFIAPGRTDYKHLYCDDAAWAAFKEAVDQLFTSDFEGALVALGQRMTFKGLDGLRDAIREWLTPWTSYYDEIEDVQPAGEDRVIVFARQHGHRMDTAAEVVAESAGVYLLRDGKIVQMDLYLDRGEALEAVGLSEQDAHADS
jgi:ketosteroid isomerase-like protein